MNNAYVFFLIDVSGSLAEERLSSVKDILDTLIREELKLPDQTELKFMALLFSEKTRWLSPKPQNKKEIITSLQKIENEDPLGSNFAPACKELCERLKFIITDNQSHYYYPNIILFSDGMFSDVYKQAIDELKHNPLVRSENLTSVMFAEDDLECNPKSLVLFSGMNQILSTSNKNSYYTKATSVELASRLAFTEIPQEEEKAHKSYKESNYLTEW